MVQLSRTRSLLLFVALNAGLLSTARAEDAAQPHVYRNTLKPIENPQPILADHPEYITPITEVARFEAPTLIDDPEADISLRAWRFSYNARGIIEIPNKLRGDRTAIVVVHPWGIDDGQGWNTPEPAGVAFQCTPAKNKIVRDHARAMIDSLLKKWRNDVAFVVYSLPGKEDPIRKKLYRSVRGKTTTEARAVGQRELEQKLKEFPYQGQSLPAEITLKSGAAAVDYFAAFPGLDATAKYNHEGFWDQPIPVMKEIDVALDDVVIYDAEGYALLRDFLKFQGVRHVILTGYNTDMCVCATTAGYENLRKDFNVFLVGDATIATFPANPTPALATNAAVSYAALNLFITQASWIQPAGDTTVAKSTAQK